MFCTVCGTKLDDGVMYCPECGAVVEGAVAAQQNIEKPAVQPQVTSQQMNQPQVTQQQMYQQSQQIHEMQKQFGNQMPPQQVPQQIPSQMQPGMTGQPQFALQEPSQKKQKAPKQPGQKKSKAPLIISIAVILLLAIAAVLVFVVIKPFAKKSAQEKALDRYFEACGNADIEALDRACFPQEALDAGAGTKDKAGYTFYMFNQMGFTRGLAEIDMFRTEPEVFAGYPQLDIRNYESSDAYYDVVNNNENTQKLFKDLDFSVDYKLLNLYKWGEKDLVRYVGLKTEPIEDMDEVVRYSTGGDSPEILDVDDMYIAQVSVEWSYGDKLYGFDKKLWDVPSVAERASQIKTLETYETAVENAKNNVYILLIYQYDGEWYVYPEGLTAGIRLYRIE